MAKEKHPWDQLKEEDAAAYARFLMYRNLGPTRTIDLAYALAREAKRGKGKQTSKRASGEWMRNSTNFDWPMRASAWDVAMLAEVGKKVVVHYVHALERAALKTLAVLEDPKVKPRGWGGAIEAINVLGGFIPAETIAAIRADTAVPGADGGGASG